LRSGGTGRWQWWYGDEKSGGIHWFVEQVATFTATTASPIACTIGGCVAWGGCCYMCCTRVVTKQLITRTCVQMRLGGYGFPSSHADTLSVSFLQLALALTSARQRLA
jgi:hypothetical protein